ncbi:thioredoxin [Cronobacter turicensis]|uniref:thioredoxin n=1 Tax=Cronobacter turicensis TaxID=413502 RepID=UPI001E173893|nr:thioredoxin [Cronobacter turicensis]EGT4493830.1 thioredoxin [Cronobacter turicensis]EKM0439779.1 thioredoxin [Cronobacter turicensis]ELY4323447.1 thioredoxin [Cronobacter turicensis]ELY5944753.1 thioredoxin [Cronobacter turicensis]ELY5965817.1 thioredoxin [Cronobacter turicensis]
MSAKSVSAADFHQEVLSHEQPVLVDFWAPWCSPCRTVAPVIDDLARDYQGKVKIVKLNIDDNPQIAADYGIRSIPFFKLFVNGDVVMECTGVRPRHDFDAALHSFTL